MESNVADSKYVYTADIAAVNLVDFLRKVPTVRCTIGEVRRDKYSSGDDLVAVGAEVTSNMNPSYFLGGKNSAVELDKFKGIGGLNPKSLVNLYFSKNPEDQEDKEVIVERLKNLSYHKELVMLFNIGEDMIASPEIAKTVFGAKNVTLTGCIWKMNLKTNRFESFVVLSGDSRMGTRVSLEGYGRDFSLKRLEGEKSLDMVKASRFGYILPVEISDGKNTYAVDGKYIYRVYRDYSEVVGKLHGDRIEFIKEKEAATKGKLGQYLKENYGYFVKHLEFIPPYGLVEPHVVRL